MEDMDNVMSHIEACEPVKMDFYTDRGFGSGYLKVADSCINGILVLWNDLYLNINDCEENIFCHQFEGSDLISKKEYLFAMDYLSNVLTAYKNTGKKFTKVCLKGLSANFIHILKNMDLYMVNFPFMLKPCFL